MKLLILLITATASAILYRLGGWSKGNRLFRVIGVPIASLLAIWACFGLNLAPWWAYVLTFGLTAGAVSAYWGLDEKKWGYWAHGLGLALAVLPIAIITNHYLGFSIRCLVLTGAMMLWSQIIKNDIVEESGRGALIIITLPILLL